jgi:hypothetical protein
MPKASPVNNLIPYWASVVFSCFFGFFFFWRFVSCLVSDSPIESVQVQSASCHYFCRMGGLAGGLAGWPVHSHFRRLFFMTVR